MNNRTVGGALCLALLITGFISQAISASPQHGVQTGSSQQPTTDQIKFYDEEVKPLLKSACFSCHGAGANLSGDLSLISHASILKGGSSGPAINLKSPSESLIVKAVNYNGREMPPSGKLQKPQIDLITKWVEMGAPTSLVGSTPSVPNAPKHIVPPQVNAQTMSFWSFRPIKRPAVPAVVSKRWVSNPIDAFILARLEAKHLTPPESASKTVLLRRATYDLIGLPPTPAEVRAFLADNSQNAYEKVVDRLLASPQYGERWARHWLDLVRYAESNSFERDNPKPFVWRYRDYVIQSFNHDKPYDQFVREQLAGDEMSNASDESLIATGYFRLGAWDDEPADPEQARYDELDDLVATTGQVFLGLTVNCARCHDHKLDPIPQTDYYRMLAFFQGTTRYGGGNGSVEKNSLRPLGPASEKARFAEEDADYHRKLGGVEKELDGIESSIKRDLSPVEVEEFENPQARLGILKKRIPRLVTEADYRRAEELTKQKTALEQAPPKGLEQALCVTESGRNPGRTFVMLRGNPHVPGDEVEPAFLSVLAPPKPAIETLAASVPSSGRRLALANWIVSPSNQLTARVIVNRLWQFHFGRGIVRSSSNFGNLGNRPTHPELMDWLSTELVKDGWRLKALHRLIMLSSAYRMSSKGNAAGLTKDPENDLFWRFDMRRLDAEEIRDSILVVNGTLNPKMFGPPIYPTIPAEVLAGESHPGLNWEKSTPDEQARRSIYIHIKRSVTVPILASFDAADTDFTCPVRFATTQPTQALGLMNSSFSNDQARIFAGFAIRTVGETPAAQVRCVLERSLQRPVTAREVDLGVGFIRSLMAKNHVSEHEALRYFCVVALNLNEFIYLD